MAKNANTQAKKPTHQEIAQRAYQIFEQSGRAPGRDLDNWLQAEAQLSGRAQPQPASTGQISPSSRLSIVRK